MQAIKINRKTLETDIKLELELNSTKPSKINTTIAFFDHMLSHIAKHGLIKINLEVKGDTKVDYHHTVEDVAIVLGQAFDQALADMTGVARYGHFCIPMEETLATVAIDIRKSAHFQYRVPDIFVGLIGTFDCELVEEFFRSLALNGRLNLHILVHYGQNKHHISEAIFKCFGKAFWRASASSKQDILFSTKGKLE